MKYGQDTVAWVRSVMAPDNPVPGDVPSGSEEDLYLQQAHDRILALARNDTAAPPRPSGAGLPGRGQPRGGRARRVIAPVAAGLAVAGLVTGVTLAASSRVPARGPATGAPARGPAAGALAAADKGMPRFYVTLSWPGVHLAGGLPVPPGHLIAEVHASQTGQVLSRVGVGFPGNGMGISADQSDRAFVIDAAASNDEAGPGPTALYLLRVSADGRSTTLTKLPLVLLPPGSPDVVDGIAVSPDGTKLAVALQVNQDPSVLNPRGEIVVYSLNGGATQAWTAPQDKAVPWDPAWTGGSRYLTFVWQDHLAGTIWFSTGRSQVRRLDTAAPGRNLLASQVLVTGGGPVGFIQAASAGPAESPIIAAVFQVPSTGARGTARLRLVALSPATGAITQVFASHTAGYAGQRQEGIAVASCQVLGADPTGQHTLAYCPHFSRIDNGTLTPLPHNAGVFAAAW
jgi:hypothetical protein